MAFAENSANSVNERSKEEITALSRDGLSRENPDALFDGFFAAWPATLYALAGKCISFLGIVVTRLVTSFSRQSCSLASQSSASWAT